MQETAKVADLLGGEERMEENIQNTITKFAQARKNVEVRKNLFFEKILHEYVDFYCNLKNSPL